MRKLRRAVAEFSLFEPGDRVAVAFSGGIDSRVLLELLQSWSGLGPPHPNATPSKLKLIALHVDGSQWGLPDNRERIRKQLAEQNLDFEILPLEMDPSDTTPPHCFRCAFKRKKALFSAAKSHGCTHIAIGHHLDDAIATTLMSLFHKGIVETLEPSRSFFEGEITLVRPMIYISKQEIQRYANLRAWSEALALPCPREERTRRLEMESLIKSVARSNKKQIRSNLFNAGRKAMGF